QFFRRHLFAHARPRRTTAPYLRIIAASPATSSPVLVPIPLFPFSFSANCGALAVPTGNGPPFATFYNAR
ncbi:MAG TPA: hypothetical protein VKB21_05370, partial [Candidatus Acidoferrum sp.]|nr:hypothetical protein [Candidatus Acidoferrum sp.]